MKSPLLPKNETARLSALKNYQILDTASEQSLDDITSLASHICGTPIALISLLDENRQWFKSAVGLDVSETPRSISFCGHAILGEDIFEVPDALNDARFSDNPLVTGKPDIRFYAGVPLITEEGYALGTLCVIDQTKRLLTAEQRIALKKLANQVVLQIAHRLTMLKMAEMKEMLERTGALAKVGGWELDIATMQIQWTKEVFSIYELDATEPPSVAQALSFYAPEARPIISEAVSRAMATGEPWDLELPFITAKNNPIWVRAQGSAIFENGRVSRLIGTFQNINQAKQNRLDLAWVNRALLILSKSNETLIHMKNEKKLITEICRIAVDIGGYRMAWVGYAENDEYKLIDPKAYYGDGNRQFLKNMNLSWSDQIPKGLGPGGRTVRHGKAVVVDDLMQDPTYPVKEAAFEQGYLSLISLPLKSKSHTFGILAMYGAQARIFSAEEVALLQELADNLAAGIMNIRAENERQRLNLAMLTLAQSVSAVRGEAFFAELVRNMVETSGAQAGYIAKLLPEKPLKGSMLASIVDGKMMENLDYLIPDALAEKLFGKKDLYIAKSHAATLFPNLSMMRYYPYQAFAGLRLHDSQGESLGLLFIFFKQAIDENALILIKSTLNIFAARAASELERLEADNVIKDQASLLDKTHDAIVVRDMQHRITFWNKGAELLYGWKKSEVLQKPLWQVLQHDKTQFEEATDALLANEEWVGEMVEQDKNGTRHIVETSWTLVRSQDAQPKSIFSINVNVSARKLAEQEILKMAFYDPLTKLPNRRLLLDRLEKALLQTKRSKSFGALMFIDLDNFKTLNDTFGHDKGDALLQEVAFRLTKCVRDIDTVARLGGDEFVVLIEDLSTEMHKATASASKIGNKIIAKLNRAFDFNGLQHISTPSIGIALFNHQTQSVEQLLKQADTAMYQSKTTGKNRFTFFQA